MSALKLPARLACITLARTYTIFPAQVNLRPHPCTYRPSRARTPSPRPMYTSSRAHATHLPSASTLSTKPTHLDLRAHVHCTWCPRTLPPRELIPRPWSTEFTPRMYLRRVWCLRTCEPYQLRLQTTPRAYVHHLSITHALNSSVVFKAHHLHLPLRPRNSLLTRTYHTPGSHTYYPSPAHIYRLRPRTPSFVRTSIIYRAGSHFGSVQNGPSHTYPDMLEPNGYCAVPGGAGASNVLCKRKDYLCKRMDFLVRGHSWVATDMHVTPVHSPRRKAFVVFISSQGPKRVICLPLGHL